MFESFHIENFRLFSSISIERLRRVNLFVGRNNSGKSALLEAIELYASNASPRVLSDLVTSRQEMWNATSTAGSDIATDVHPLRHLFRGHRFPGLDETGIVLGPVRPKEEQLRLAVAAYRAEIGDEGLRRYVHVTQQDLFSSADDLDVVPMLTAYEGGRSRRIVNLTRELYREARRSSGFPGAFEESRLPIQVVPTRNMTETKIATLWDATLLTAGEPEVIAALKLIDSTITGVAFVESSPSTKSRIPIIKVSHIDEPLPLKSMGDGMTRLFHIIVALVNAKSGILVIDEFENGLHWSVQARVWKTVFRVASSLGVQVFASTHSRDCIKGFEEAWQEHVADGAFYRLDCKLPGDIRVVGYDLETLSDAVETEVEVR